MESNDEDQPTKCPFAKLGGPNPHTKEESEKKDDNDNREIEMINKSERCPWPFVFFHDPKTGIRDWQSWVVIGLILCWGWTVYQKSNES